MVPGADHEGRDETGEADEIIQPGQMFSILNWQREPEMPGNGKMTGPAVGTRGRWEVIRVQAELELGFLWGQSPM